MNAKTGEISSLTPKSQHNRFQAENEAENFDFNTRPLGLKNFSAPGQTNQNVLLRLIWGSIFEGWLLLGKLVLHRLH